jgi:hypothetical protein
MAPLPLLAREYDERAKRVRVACVVLLLMITLGEYADTVQNFDWNE